MHVSTDELEAILRRASYGAAARELSALDRVLGAMRAAETTADLSSAHSKFLLNVIETCEPYLVARAPHALRHVHLYGVGHEYVNAVPDVSLQTPRIFVFEGLLHTLHYTIDLIKVMDRLQALRPDARLRWDGEELRESEAFSMAGFAILADAITNHRFPALLHDMLGPVARNDVMTAYRLGILFVLFHELGHIELGHLGESRSHSERQSFSLAEPELLTAAQEDEVEADAFALDHIAPHMKQEIVPSLVFYFAPFTFLETFSGRSSLSHPLAINRLSALADRANMPPEVKNIIGPWIEGQLGALHRTSQPRKEAGGDLRTRIEENMPLRRAHDVLRTIKERVMRETGPLDRPQ